MVRLGSQVEGEADGSSRHYYYYRLRKELYRMDLIGELHLLIQTFTIQV